MEASLEKVGSKDELESAVAELEVSKNESELEVSKNETELILKEKGILEEEIQYLKLCDKNQRAINIRLNTKIHWFRARLLEKKVEASKFFRKEI